jgi:hypothetical protein
VKEFQHKQRVDFSGDRREEEELCIEDREEDSGRLRVWEVYERRAGGGLGEIERKKGGSR